MEAQKPMIGAVVPRQSVDSRIVQAEMDAYLSAEERAQLIEAEFKSLASPLAELTPHLYKTDRPRFDEVDQVVAAGLNRIEAMIVGLRMAADSEYAPTPWHVRTLLWIFCWIGAVQRTRHPIIKAHRRHQARIDAADRYEELIQNHLEQIHDIRYAKVNQRMEEILLKNKGYQEALSQYEQVYAVHGHCSSECGSREYLQKSSAWLENERNRAREVATGEFQDEDF